MQYDTKIPIDKASPKLSKSAKRQSVNETSETDAASRALPSLV